MWTSTMTRRKHCHPSEPHLGKNLPFLGSWTWPCSYQTIHIYSGLAPWNYELWKLPHHTERITDWPMRSRQWNLSSNLNIEYKFNKSTPEQCSFGEKKGFIWLTIPSFSPSLRSQVRTLRQSGHIIDTVKVVEKCVYLCTYIIQDSEAGRLLSQLQG